MIFSNASINKFGLENPGLENQQQIFVGGVLYTLRELQRHYNPEIEMILEGTELDYKKKLFGYSSYVQLFESVQHNYLGFLAFLDIFLRRCFEFMESFEMGPVREGLDPIIKFMDICDLDYVWDEPRKEILRKISKLDSSIINQNREYIKEGQGEKNLDMYDHAVNEFLHNYGHSDKKMYKQSLGNLKEVYERSLQNKIKKDNGESCRVNNYKLILEKLFKKDPEMLQEQNKILKFIVMNIHHSQEDEEGKSVPYDFNETEYIYWWLQINNLIYLINQVA